MILRRLCTRLKERLIKTRRNKLVECNTKVETNLSWPWRVSYSSPGEQPSRTRVFSLTLSDHLALNRPGLGYLPAPTPPAKKIKQKDLYTLLDLYISTRHIRLLTPSSLNASFSFTCSKTLPDETWEALARTSRMAFSGTSATFSTISPIFWEFRGEMGY